MSLNEEAYKFTDVSYLSRFNRDIYDTLEKNATDFKFALCFLPENTGQS